MFKYIKSSFKGGSTKPLSLKGHLGSTDAAPEVPLLCPMRRRAWDAAARASPRIPPRRATWIPRDFHRLAPTQANAASTRADLPGIRPKFKKKRCRTHHLT